jgi:hypothetical protein
MRNVFILIVLLVTAPFALAAEETPVTPSEFRDYAEGYTLYFDRDGEAFGSESFESGGKSRWRYNDGSCVRGAWRGHEDQICFLYEYEAVGGEGEILCWHVFRDADGLFARLLSGENAGLELRITGRDKRPLLCGEPGTST